MSRLNHTCPSEPSLTGTGTPAPEVKLTAKELETLQWVVRGKTAWEIARIQGCTEAAVNFHFCNIRRKFGVSKLRAAAIRAIELGVVMLH